MSRSTPLRAVAAFLALAPALAAAQHAVVTADEVLAAMRAPRKAVVVDARTAAEYDQAHIRGAIHLPPERVQAEAKRLPKDKSTPLVFYCRGPG
jgi:rhodanese-related sulfurtransferase